MFISLHIYNTYDIYINTRIIQTTCNKHIYRIYGEREGQPKIQVRTFRLIETSRMRDLDPSNIDQLMSIKVTHI
jgi:DNA replicative helicase MCM subunit Mcm2 (Cdc46/Mcm family)